MLGKYYIVVMFANSPQLIITPSQFEELPSELSERIIDYKTSMNGIKYLSPEDKVKMYEELKKLQRTHENTVTMNDIATKSCIMIYVS